MTSVLLYAEIIIESEWLLLGYISRLKFCLFFLATFWAIFGENWAIFCFLVLATLYPIHLLSLNVAEVFY